MVVTKYEGMKAYADLDRTQCELQISLNEGVTVPPKDISGWAQIQDIYNVVVFLEGPVDGLKKAEDGPIGDLYEEIKGEKYFIIISEGW